MKRYSILFALLAVICFFWIRGRADLADPYTQTTILLASSPVSLWTWDKNHDTFTVLIIPSDYVINGKDGYGKYSLESLWKLGFIDKKDGILLARSLEQALAVRVPFYVGKEIESFNDNATLVQRGKKIFSLSSIGKVVLHTIKTNMPLNTYIAFSWALQRARLDAIRVIDVSKLSIIIPEELPDGTDRSVINIDRLDAVLKGVYEDEFLASDGTTVSIYNSTTTPSLGTQAARMLSNLGILVVAVGNASPQKAGCVISGTNQALSTKTARLIRKLFTCDVSEQAQQQQADVTVHLGIANVQ